MKGLRYLLIVIVFGGFLTFLPVQVVYARYLALDPMIAGASWWNGIPPLIVFWVIASIVSVLPGALFSNRAR